MKSALRNLVDEVPFFPVPVRLRCSSVGMVDFWWSRLAAEIDISISGMIYRGSENGDLEFLKRFLKIGMTYVDIGAYHGLYAAVAGRQIGKTGQVILFEPSVAACRRARLNLVLNRVKATIENAAVSDSSGIVSYHEIVKGFKTMGGLKRPASRDPVRIKQVKSVTIDDYCREHSCDRIDLLKIDAEGAELSVLSGARYVLENFRPIIICEVLDWVTEPWGYQAKKIIETLSDYGYKWFDIDDDGGLTEHIVRNAYPDIRNYLGVPDEQARSIPRAGAVS